MLNYFTLLGLEPEYDIKQSAVHDAYVALQQETHPDRMIGKSDAERAEAIQTSMDANEAYKTLKDPLKRAQHLLELQGIFVNSEGNDTIKPAPELLMESMEMREQLEGCVAERDVALMVEDLKKAMRFTEKDVSGAFQNNQYETAAQHTLRLRYLGKCLEEAYMRQYQMKQQV